MPGQDGLNKPMAGLQQPRKSPRVVGHLSNGIFLDDINQHHQQNTVLSCTKGWCSLLTSISEMDHVCLNGNHKTNNRNQGQKNVTRYPRCSLGFNRPHKIRWNCLTADNPPIASRRTNIIFPTNISLARE